MSLYNTVSKYPLLAKCRFQVEARFEDNRAIRTFHHPISSLPAVSLTISVVYNLSRRSQARLLVAQAPTGDRGRSPSAIDPPRTVFPTVGIVD